MDAAACGMWSVAPCSYQPPWILPFAPVCLWPMWGPGSAAQDEELGKEQTEQGSFKAGHGSGVTALQGKLDLVHLELQRVQASLGEELVRLRRQLGLAEREPQQRHRTSEASVQTEAVEDELQEVNKQRTAKSGLENCCFTMHDTLSDERLRDKFDGEDKKGVDEADVPFIDDGITVDGKPPEIDSEDEEDSEDSEDEHGEEYKELEGVKNPIMMKVYREADPEEKREKHPAEMATGFWDPAGLTADGEDAAFKSTRSIEIKHGRVSMAACFGYIAPEYLKWPEEISTYLGLKFAELCWVQKVFCAGINEGTSSAGEYRAEDESNSQKIEARNLENYCLVVRNAPQTEVDDAGTNSTITVEDSGIGTAGNQTQSGDDVSGVGTLNSGQKKKYGDNSKDSKLVDQVPKDSCIAQIHLEDYCFMMGAILSEKRLKDKIGGGDREKIEKAVQDAYAWLGKNPLARKGDVEAKQKELEGVLNPILGSW